MPTDKFEELLKSLNMLVPLTQNMQLYVDLNSDGDSIVDGRGTQAKPFKHIRNCVNYVVENYSIGRWDVYINVAAGTYEESIPLPEFSRGAGKIYIRPASGARDVTVAATTNSLGTRGWCFSCSGGYWVIDRIAMSRVENPTTQRNVTTGCVACSSGVVELTGIAMSQSYPSEPSPLGGIPYALRLMWASANGRIILDPNDYGVGMSLSFQDDYAASGIATDVMYASNLGQIVLSHTTVDAASVDVACSGSCTDFVLTINGACLTNSGAGRSLAFSGAGVTGKRYNALNGSFISTGGSGDTSTFFPGDVAGYVDSSTYCWYK